MASILDNTAAFHSALAWLNSQSADDPVRDLVPLRRHLQQALQAGMAPLPRLKILELFNARAVAANDALRPQLLAAALPLAQRMRALAQGLLEIHGLIAEGYLAVINEADPLKLQQQREDGPAALAEAALDNLARQQVIGLLASMAAPAQMWSRAQAIYRGHGIGGETSTADRPAGIEPVFKSMLALATAQADGCAPEDVAFLAEYGRRFAEAIEIREEPVAPVDNWYWLDEGRDLPPVAASRRLPPVTGSALWFCCSALALMAKQHLAQLASGASAADLGLPEALAGNSCRHVLVAAEKAWLAPAKRHWQRRSSHDRVELCTEANRLWEMLRQEPASTPDNDLAGISNWMILNESPGGYSVMHVTGSVNGLRAGHLLGLRTSPAGPWGVCLVRWARSENPEHIEVGLELISPTAQAVTIAGPANGGEAIATKALLLPAIPGLNRDETLLTGPGYYGGDKLTLVADEEGKLRISQCRGLRLVMQSSAIEVFEFERDYSAR